MAPRDDDNGVPPKRPDPRAPLPPELNPRGRRAGRREQKAAAAAAAAASTPNGVGPGPRRGRGQARRDARRGLRLGAATVAGVLSLAVLVGSGWAWATWTNFTASIKRVDAIPAAPSQKPKHDIDGKDQNILIVGNDDRSGATDAELAALGTTKDGGTLNTDTMMLMHVPADGSKATVISFPRDSYVAIPGHGMGKLNSAYPDGVIAANGNKAAGAQLLVQTIQNLTGLTIDHFVQVDLFGFYRISNAIGGVRVNLCEPQHEANSGIDLPAGWSTIKGKQALAFVRQRYGLPGGDLDRIKRQHYFLSAVFRKLTSEGVLLNPFKLKNVLNAVSSSLYMDGDSPGHKGLNPLDLAEQMQNLTAGNLTFSTIPNDGGTTNEAGAVIVVNPAEVKAWVDKMVNPPKSTPPSSKGSTGPAPSSITVDVINGAGANGVAGNNADLLSKLGFKTGSIGTAPTPVAHTVVEYPTGMKAQAEVVASKVSGATTSEDASVQTVTLLLGTDGAHVQGASGGSTSGNSGSGGSSANQPKVVNAAENSTGCIN